MRVAVANQKGGVGKTTTAVNLAYALAELGHRTLIVDLDPQANATTGLGIDHRKLERSVYEVIIDDLPAKDAIVPSGYEGLDLLPSSIDLAGAELELVPTFSRESKLRRALDGLDGGYAAIFIDCPPSLGLLTVNALAAASYMLVPIQCEYYALEGLSQLLRNVELVRSGLNPELEIGGIVLTMYDARTKLSEQVAEEIRSHFPDRVFSTVIPRSVRLSEAPSYGQPAVVYDSSSRGAMAYGWLGEEFAERFLTKDDTPGAPENVDEVPQPESGEAPAGDEDAGTTQRESAATGGEIEPPHGDEEMRRPLTPGWALSVARTLIGGKGPGTGEDPEGPSDQEGSPTPQVTLEGGEEPGADPEGDREEGWGGTA